MVSETRRVITELEGFTEELIRRLASNITAELIETTPVDTGWARANWIPQLGVPLLEDLTGIAPTSAEVAAAAGQQAAGQAEIAGYTIEVGAIFISNNVPYILILNDGSSTQAPPMFIEMAIERGIVAVGNTASSP